MVALSEVFGAKRMRPSCQIFVRFARQRMTFWETQVKPIDPQ